MKYLHYFDYFYIVHSHCWAQYLVDLYLAQGAQLIEPSTPSSTEKLDSLSTSLSSIYTKFRSSTAIRNFLYMEYKVNSITSVNSMLVGVVISLYFNRSNVTSSYNRPIEMKAVLAAVMGAQSAFAQSSQADYLQGYIRGTMDTKDICTDVCHWYVLELGHGFAHQSKEFSMGFVRGFCSVSSGTSSDDDSASWDCNEGPSSASWVTG